MSDESSWFESVVVALYLGPLLAILTWPAFDGFFFGEDFITRGLYLNSGGDFLRAVFTPFTGFLRPSAVAWSIATQFLLPWDPFFHHARNLFFDVVALVVLHRILLALGLSRTGRLAGVAFFAVSRIHLTLVGYINCIDNIGTLLYQLLAILFLLRAQDAGGWLALLPSLACAGLSCFARDLGCMVMLPLLGIVWLSPRPGTWLTARKRRALYVSLALGGIFLGYLAVRMWIVGLPYGPSGAGTSPYALRLNLSRLVTAPLASLGMVLGTPIFSDSQNAGTSDFTTVLGLSGSAVPWARALFVAIFSLLLLAGAAAVAKVRPMLLFPLLWILGFCCPLAFIGTFNAYYTYEASAATAMLLACIISLPSFSRLAKRLMLCGVLLMAMSSWAHRTDIRGMVWHWVGDQVRSFYEQVIVPSQNRHVTVLRLVVPDEPQKRFWHYLIDPVTLMPSAVPMLRTLLRPSVQAYEVHVAGSPEIEERLREPGVVTFTLKPGLVFEEYRAN